jgi:DNA-binding CsgD family transcriptional regulator
LLEAFEAYEIAGGYTADILANDIAAVAGKTSASAGSLTLQDHLLDGTTAFYEGDRIRAYEHFRRTGDLLRAGDAPDDQVAKWALFGIAVMTEMFDDSTYNLWVARADAHLRQNGALLGLLFNLIAQMSADVRSGRLRAAAVRHAEILDVGAAVGLPAEYHRHMDDFLRAWMGDEEATRASAAASFEINSLIGSVQVVMTGHLALATLHIGAGRYEEALVETDFVRAEDTLGIPSHALPLAVEAAARLGQNEKAEIALADLESRAVASGTPWALGLLARCRALVADSAEAEKYFEESIGHLERTSVTPELARTRLLYGEWLRRMKRRTHARLQLTEAYDYFTEIGALGFARRSEAELRATGERVRRPGVRQGIDLTPQESRVAQLAAEMLTNPEIGAQMFISPATVAYHLRKVFRKLGIDSRRQLGAALRDHAV